MTEPAATDCGMPFMFTTGVMLGTVEPPVLVKLAVRLTAAAGIVNDAVAEAGAPMPLADQLENL